MAQETRNGQTAVETGKDPLTPTKLRSDIDNSAHHRSFRPHLHHSDNAGGKRSNKEKAPPSPLPRRSSWISSLSSKFSSSTSTALSPQLSPPGKELPSPPKEEGDSISALPSLSPRSPNGTQPQPSPSSSPSPSVKTPGPSFLQSALRRLSSAGSGGLGKAAGSGGLCPRRVLNVDPYRERCQVNDVQPGRLRRVSFCVDVQIASAAPTDEDEPPAIPEKLSLADPEETEISPSVTQYFKESKPGQIDKLPSKKKTKDPDLKAKDMSEGEALKDPDSVVEAKEDSINKELPMINGAPTIATSPDDNNDMEQSKRKKEKKKRSEEERKERKEKRRQQAVANGAVPIELALEAPSTGSSSGNSSPPQSQVNKPTTDPLRIYKRCCQLRETHALRRVAEQLHTAPNDALQCLDLSGLRFQLPDVITFGDFLAIVPVRRLNLTDCGLTDEAVRVILAGLLSVKTPEQAEFNRRLNQQKPAAPEREKEQFGVVEKLCLKNNPKIGREGWRYLSYFIHMSQSIKAIDLTGVLFPLALSRTRSNSQGQSHPKSPGASKPVVDLSNIFTECLAKRLFGSRLEELVLADCDLRPDDIEKIVDACISSGVKRLSLSKNRLTEKGAAAVVRYLESGNCEALDLGGIDISEMSDILAAPISRTVKTNPLYALSLESCNLSTSALQTWLSVLPKLSNFRFLDLSHNRQLFARQPTAVGLLRRHLPRMSYLKRLNLNDVALEPDHCIAIAEVLAEMPCIAHISLLENPAVKALASAKDVAAEEEACAMYASLMSAARVSKTIMSIEVDMPSKESGEIVQAIAKQILAYSLRNLETDPITKVDGHADGTTKPTKAVEVPEILMHLVGHVDGNPENHDDDEPAPDQAYLVSGTAVVKTLSVCLRNKVEDGRRPSQDIVRQATDRSATPDLPGTKSAPIKAMSLDMLDSAKKIRSRLKLALQRESVRDDEMSLKRLHFLLSTLNRIVQQFEAEYPECRPPTPPEAGAANGQRANGDVLSPPVDGTLSRTTSRIMPPDDDDENAEEEEKLRPGRISRRASDISLASKSLANEEGRVHRIGNQVRREVVEPLMNQADDAEGRERALDEFKSTFEAMSGEELKAQLDGFEGRDKGELIDQVMKRLQDKQRT